METVLQKGLKSYECDYYISNLKQEELQQIHFVWVGGTIPRTYLERINRVAMVANRSGFAVNLWTDNMMNIIKAEVKDEIKVEEREDSWNISRDIRANQDINVNENIRVRNIKELESNNQFLNRNTNKKLWGRIQNEMCGKNRNLGAASDMIRLSALLNEGGYYFDTDTWFIDLERSSSEKYWEKVDIGSNLENRFVSEFCRKLWDQFLTKQKFKTFKNGSKDYQTATSFHNSTMELFQKEFNGRLMPQLQEEFNEKFELYLNEILDNLHPDLNEMKKEFRSELMSKKGLICSNVLKSSKAEWETWFNFRLGFKYNFKIQFTQDIYEKNDTSYSVTQPRRNIDNVTFLSEDQKVSSKFNQGHRGGGLANDMIYVKEPNNQIISNMMQRIVSYYDTGSYTFSKSEFNVNDAQKILENSYGNPHLSPGFKSYDLTKKCHQATLIDQKRSAKPSDPSRPFSTNFGNLSRTNGTLIFTGPNCLRSELLSDIHYNEYEPRYIIGEDVFCDMLWQDNKMMGIRVGTCSDQTWCKSMENVRASRFDEI